MKTIGALLVALSVLTGVTLSVAAPANAATWAQQLEQEGRFGHDR